MISGGSSGATKELWSGTPKIRPFRTRSRPLFVEGYNQGLCLLRQDIAAKFLLSGKNRRSIYTPAKSTAKGARSGAYSYSLICESIGGGNFTETIIPHLTPSYLLQSAHANEYNPVKP